MKMGLPFKEQSSTKNTFGEKSRFRKGEKQVYLRQLWEKRLCEKTDIDFLNSKMFWKRSWSFFWRSGLAKTFTRKMLDLLEDPVFRRMNANWVKELHWLLKKKQNCSPFFFKKDTNENLNKIKWKRCLKIFSGKFQRKKNKLTKLTKT